MRIANEESLREIEDLRFQQEQVRAASGEATDARTDEERADGGGEEVTTQDSEQTSARQE